jgi:PAS domain S-box-containing protein
MSIWAAMRSLSTRVVVAFVAVIVLTTIGSGVPAYRLIRTELEEQAWAHVADGGRATLALIEAEQARLADMAVLTAQRPTLQRLLREGDAEALSEYLQVFQANAELAILTVRDASGGIQAEDTLPSAWSDLPYSQDVTFYPLPGRESRLALLASRPVVDEQSGALVGYVTVGIFLDDDFVRQLENKTGFEQSIVLEGQRVATSLPGIPAVVGSGSAGHAPASEQGETHIVSYGDAYYYTTLLPLRDAQGNTVAQAEVALPVGGLLTAERQALLALGFATLLVAVIISTLSGIYARRLTAPLRQLTIAAHNIGQGDFGTPIPVPDRPVEVATLAHALEESRVNTRRALNNSAEARAWLETLIQSVTEGIVTVDEQGHITSLNQGVTRITGWASDEVQGQPIDRVFKLSGGNEPFTSRISISPGTGMRRVSILTRSGQAATLAVTGARLNPPNGHTAQTVLVLRDVTEQEAVQRLRSDFLANISHEFRTPLSSLNASVELLLDEIEDLSTAEVVELMSSIHRSVTGLQTLIDNLLESSRIEAGRFSIRRRPSDLNEIVTEATRMVDPLLERRWQHLSLSGPAHLQPVNVDPTRLTQVLVNLLSNASKYSPVGQPIDLILEQPDGNLLRISVADRGPGVSPADQANLFRRFVRLDAQDGTQYGVGLGLSVVKAIVEEHGGTVGIDSRPGGGAVFWFTLPLGDNWL